MFRQHTGAGAGRDDDVVVSREGFDHRPREVFGEPPVAGIIGWLAATGLQWDFDAAARIFEQLDGRPADRRAEKIDETGDEKADTRLQRKCPCGNYRPAGRRVNIVRETWARRSNTSSWSIRRAGARKARVFIFARAIFRRTRRASSRIRTAGPDAYVTIKGAGRDQPRGI